MHIICLTPLEVGVYNDHKSDSIATPPEGWAMIPENFPLPSTFPRLGSIEAEEITYTYEVEVEKEVVKTREVEMPVVKTREVEVTDENGETKTVTEEYTETELVTEEYTEKVLVTEQREKVILTVTAMTEGTLPDIPEEEPEPTTEERVTELEETVAAQENSIYELTEYQAELLFEVSLLQMGITE